jgi:hypothetical protein
VPSEAGRSVRVVTTAVVNGTTMKIPSKKIAVRK